jgi:hypothetical protein
MNWDTLYYKVLDTDGRKRILNAVQKVRPIREPGPEPLRLELRAADNLRFIRETMENAGRFTAVPGWGGVGMGVTALAAAVVASQQTTPAHWLIVWAAELAIAIILASSATVMKARATTGRIFSGPGRRFALSFVPPLLVGALLTVVFYHAGIVQALPGMWLLLYGTAVVTGGAFSVRVVPLMGLCIMVAGAAALVAPAAWGNVFMGFGFGVLEIVFGLFIALRHGG